MHFLPFLIVGFSASFATLLVENSDEPILANTQLVDPPHSNALSSNLVDSGNEPSPVNFNLDASPLELTALSGSSSLNPITPANGPSPVNLNLDAPPFELTALSGSSSLNPITADNGPSPVNPDLDIVSSENLDTFDSLTSSVNLAQEPSANGATEPSTLYAAAQNHKQNSNQICYHRIGPGRKEQKELSCLNVDLLVRGGAHRGAGARTPEQQKSDELKVYDENFLDTRRFDIMSSIEKGRKACKRQGWGGDKPWALCCLGPDEYIPVPTLGWRLVRRQNLVVIRNVFNCLVFLQGRPFCADFRKRFCCRSMDEHILGDWGFKGLDCAPMEVNPDEIVDF